MSLCGCDLGCGQAGALLLAAKVVEVLLEMDSNMSKAHICQYTIS